MKKTLSLSIDRTILIDSLIHTHITVSSVLNDVIIFRGWGGVVVVVVVVHVPLCNPLNPPLSSAQVSH